MTQFEIKTCKDIIEDVEKLDAIEDVFIHLQHVDCKIADALLKNDTKQHTDGWDASNKDWAHMVLHLSHTEGGFGVSFNCVTKDVAFYTTTSRFVS